MTVRRRYEFPTEYCRSEASRARRCGYEINKHTEDRETSQRSGATAERF
jgi:hypothetical protein